MLLCVCKINSYRQHYADNQNISFLPAIMTTSSRMHGEFLRLLFLQAHCDTTAHFIATGLPSQQTRSDNVFQFKRAAFCREKERERERGGCILAKEREGSVIHLCVTLWSQQRILCVTLWYSPFSVTLSLACSLSLPPSLPSHALYLPRCLFFDLLFSRAYSRARSRSYSRMHEPKRSLHYLFPIR
jgi:hypothetical protein